MQSERPLDSEQTNAPVTEDSRPDDSEREEPAPAHDSSGNSSARQPNEALDAQDEPSVAGDNDTAELLRQIQEGLASENLGDSAPARSPSPSFSPSFPETATEEHRHTPSAYPMQHARQPEYAQQQYRARSISSASVAPSIPMPGMKWPPSLAQLPFAYWLAVDRDSGLNCLADATRSTVSASFGRPASRGARSASGPPTAPGMVAGICSAVIAPPKCPVMEYLHPRGAPRHSVIATRPGPSSISSEESAAMNAVPQTPQQQQQPAASLVQRLLPSFIYERFAPAAQTSSSTTDLDYNSGDEDVDDEDDLLSEDGSATFAGSASQYSGSLDRGFRNPRDVELLRQAQLRRVEANSRRRERLSKAREVISRAETALAKTTDDPDGLMYRYKGDIRDHGAVVDYIRAALAALPLKCSVDRRPGVPAQVYGPRDRRRAVLWLAEALELESLVDLMVLLDVDSHPTAPRLEGSNVPRALVDAGYTFNIHLRNTRKRIPASALATLFSTTWQSLLTQGWGIPSYDWLLMSREVAGADFCMPALNELQQLSFSLDTEKLVPYREDARADPPPDAFDLKIMRLFTVNALNGPLRLREWIEEFGFTPEAAQKLGIDGTHRYNARRADGKTELRAVTCRTVAAYLKFDVAEYTRHVARANRPQDETAAGTDSSADSEYRSSGRRDIKKKNAKKRESATTR